LLRIPWAHSTSVGMDCGISSGIGSDTLGCDCWSGDQFD
jgi:hypothetical protein